MNMKNTVKKFVSVLLLLCMIIAMFPCKAYADNTFTLVIKNPLYGKVELVGFNKTIEYDKQYVFSENDKLSVRVKPNPGMKLTKLYINNTNVLENELKENEEYQYLLEDCRRYWGNVTVSCRFEYTKTLQIEQLSRDGKVVVKDTKTHKVIQFDANQKGYILTPNKSYDIYLTNNPSYPENFKMDEASPEQKSKYGFRENEKPVAKNPWLVNEYEIDDCGDKDKNTWHFVYNHVDEKRRIRIYWSRYDYLRDYGSSGGLDISTHAYKGGTIAVSPNAGTEKSASLLDGSKVYLFDKGDAKKVKFQVTPKPGYEIEQINVRIRSSYSSGSYFRDYGSDAEYRKYDKKNVSSNGTFSYAIQEKDILVARNGICINTDFEVWAYFKKKIKCDHTSTKRVARNIRYATCTQAGYSGDTYCEYCGEMLEEGSIIPPKKHSGQKIYTNIRKATTKRNGYAGRIVCKECRKVIATKKVIFRPKTVKFDKKSYNYTGKAVIPSVKVIDVKGKEIPKENYTISVTNNKNPGTAKVIVKFKGYLYSGKLVKTFKIAVATPQVSSAKRTSAKTAVLKWRKISKADGYQIKYTSGKKTKIITIKKSSKTSVTIEALSKGKKYKVSIRAYKTVGKKCYYSPWSKAYYV